jgi:hypothetical protein
MGIHQLFSDVESAVRLVSRELLSGFVGGDDEKTTPALAGKTTAACSKSSGCELAPGHADGCQIEGHLSPPEELTRCVAIDTSPHLRPGWVCCQCKTYNDRSRDECKQCMHLPCVPKGDR